MSLISASYPFSDRAYKNEMKVEIYYDFEHVHVMK